MLDEIKHHYADELHLCAEGAPFARDTNADFQWLVSEVERLTEERDMWQEHYHRVLTELAARKGDPAAQVELERLARDEVSTVGGRIRRRREAVGLRAAELARRASISKAYLSELESNEKARPSADLLYRIAAVLQTTIPDLLGKPEQSR